MITRMEHVALSVSNLDRSITFYCDVLGLSLIRIIEADPALNLGAVVGMPGCSARIAHLESETVMLELFEYVNPRGKPICSDHKQADMGFIHIGFSSTDARKDYKRFCELEIKTIGEPVQFRPGVWIFYFYGPDGEVCELRES